jgi:hypothetical protein
VTVGDSARAAFSWQRGRESRCSIPVQASVPLGSQWRLIRDVNREGKIVAAEDAFGVVIEVTPETVITWRLEGHV